MSANVEGRELEGKDYNLSEDGQLEMINTDTLFETWLPDNINFKRYQSYITEEQIETYENWNDGCIPQKDPGFSFDMVPAENPDGSVLYLNRDMKENVRSERPVPGPIEKIHAGAPGAEQSAFMLWWCVSGACRFRLQNDVLYACFCYALINLFAYI